VLLISFETASMCDAGHALFHSNMTVNAFVTLWHILWWTDKQR